MCGSKVTSRAIYRFSCLICFLRVADDRHRETNEETATDWSNTLLAGIIVGAVGIVGVVVLIIIILAMCKEQRSQMATRNAHNLDTFQFPSRNISHRTSSTQIEDKG